MKITKENIVNLFAEILENKELIRGIFSNPTKKSNEYTKINIKFVTIKGELFIQLEFFQNNKAFHNNIKPSEFLTELPNFLENFKQILIVCSGKDYQILINKDKIAIKESKNNKNIETFEHNKKKNYLIEDGVKVPFLIELGVMDKNGIVIKSKYDKFRQINKYLEFIDDTVNLLENKKLLDKTIKIVDFGCGKSYLTFATEYYFTNIRKISCKIIGLDLKKDVIETCNNIAKKLNCDNLEFLTGDIKDFDKIKNVDIIFSLHACNNATDYSILKGLELNAKVIMAVPCCQKEFNQKMSKNKDSQFFEIENPIGKYGILMEKYTTLATDAYRALSLELCGYKTQVMEFIDMEHTPKNILIRGIKEKYDSSTLEKKYEELLKFKKHLGIEPLLDNLLAPYYLYNRKKTS